MGLHREAEMIEQQLKMKQNTGQLMPPGKFVLFAHKILVDYVSNGLIDNA